MTQEAVGEPARRHLSAVPPVAAQPAELEALLAELDSLRLSLSSDLGLVAAALDADAPDVARDVLVGSREDLAVFGLRADLALQGAPAGPDDAPAPPPRNPRRARRLAVLAPTLTAAAALVGLLSGVVPANAPAAPERSVVLDAAASYAELFRLHESGAPAERLALVARQLHAEVARLVALAGDDPAAARQALRLLELELQLLAGPQHRGALDAELAESQRLVQALRSAVLATPAAALADPTLADTALAPLPAPVPTPGPTRPRTGGDAVVVVPAAPQPAAPAAEPEPEPQPQPQAQPASAAEPAPAPAEQAAEEPAPAEPTPAESAPTPAPPPGPQAGDPSTWFPTTGTGSVLPR